MGSGSIGLQIGGKVSEIVFIILTEKGLHAMLDHKFKVGAEAGVTMVAVGTGFEGATTAAVGADILAFANSTGLFAGASLEGSYIDADDDWNALYYGAGATGRAIVLDRRFSNPGADASGSSSLVVVASLANAEQATGVKSEAEPALSEAGAQERRSLAAPRG